MDTTTQPITEKKIGDPAVQPVVPTTPAQPGVTIPQPAKVEPVKV